VGARKQIFSSNHQITNAYDKILQPHKLQMIGECGSEFHMKNGYDFHLLYLLLPS
ncbi:uncharacterized protein METZ01_LOCUS358810, partial [marine metagenome]